MKRILLCAIAVIIGVVACMAQDYNIHMSNVTADGKYVVEVTTVLDKKQNKTATDYLKRMAVDGVMLRGVAAGNGYNSKPALVENPDVAALKAEFFDAFNRQGLYNDFCTLEPTSVTVTELPKKKYEVSARLAIDKERLIKYLTEHQIIQNFDSLW